MLYIISIWPNHFPTCLSGQAIIRMLDHLRYIFQKIGSIDQAPLNSFQS